MSLFLNLIVKNKYLFIILFLNFITRIVVVFFYGDKTFSATDANEWGVIYENLKNFGTMSWFQHDEFRYPTFFMPPLYIFYIYSLSVFQTSFDITIILFSQCMLAIISAYVFYKICNLYFSLKLSLVALTIFCFYPIYVYASSQISSINLVILINLFFIYTILYNKKYYLIGILGGLGLLVRGEFILLYLFSLLYLIIIKKYKLKELILSLLISIIIISPYLYRNYITFNKIVITNSTGYVLWRGNNILSSVDSIYADMKIQEIEPGVDSKYLFENKELLKINQKLTKIKFNKNYEALRDKIFYDQAISNITNDPKKYFYLYIKKFLSFLFFNPSSEYPNYYNPLSLLPEIIISFTAFLGILIKLKAFKTFNYLYLYLFYNLAIYSFFLILPRYKIIIIPILIIFMISFLKNIFTFFLKKKSI